MRWYWFDRFVEFESGRRAVGIKNVSMGEEHMFDYFPGHAVMSHALILEGMAQVGGILVGEVNRFEERVVLAKVSRAKFHFPARPGDTLTYTTTIENIGPDGALVSGSSHVAGELQAEVDYYLAFLTDRTEIRKLFDPGDFLRMLRAFGLYEVGRTQDGQPLTIPPRLLQAEQASDAVERDRVSRRA